MPEIDKRAVILFVVVFAVVWLYSRRNWLNPMSSDNLAYQGAAEAYKATGLPTEDSRGVPLTDYWFAMVDIVNPWNKSDTYARDVLTQGRW